MILLFFFLEKKKVYLYFGGTLNQWHDKKLFGRRTDNGDETRTWDVGTKNASCVGMYINCFEVIR